MKLRSMPLAGARIQRVQPPLRAVRVYNETQYLPGNDRRREVLANYRF
ncbi:hypothetical protein [Burkholderia catarinensis]|nr:hypothetical protein [Burkholderia catarinensis]